MPVTVREPAGPPRPAPVIGVALSSGAARGAAHVGALIALSEHGIEPDLVVGTSAGALVGGAWAAGLSPHAIADLARETTWADFGRLWPNRNLAIIETTALRTNLNWLFRGRELADLPRRFATVATDVRTRRAALLDRGDAASAVEASIAVPGVFPAVRRDGALLVDGVLASPLPTWATHALGATRTISIRLRPESPASRREAVQRMVITPAEEVPADLEILIDTGRFASWSSRDVRPLVDLGYEATCAALDATGSPRRQEARRAAG